MPLDLFNRLRSADDNDIATNEKDLPTVPREGGNERRKNWQLHRTSLMLLVLLIFEAIVVIALQAVIFAKIEPSPISRDQGMGIPVYLLIFILSQVYQVLMVVQAILAQNTIQIIAFCLFNFCCFAYSIFQFKQISDVVRPGEGESVDQLSQLITRLLIANAVVVGVCMLVFLYLAIRLWREFGWRIYKQIGADPQIRRMYRWYQIYLTILRLDVFFFLGYSIQYLVLVLSPTDAEFPLTIIALPLTCLFLTLSVYAIKREKKILVAIFFVGLAAGCAYFIFKIYRIYDPSQLYKYVYVRAFLTFFAAVSLALLVFTIINAAICWSNFGRGLKDHLLRDKSVSCGQQPASDRPLYLD